MPKDLESLKKSRQIRKEVIDKYGDVPTSVWEPSFLKKGISQFSERTQHNVALKRHAKMKYDKTNKDLVDAFSMSSKNVRGKSNEDALSIFPPDLVRKTVRYYSERLNTVLDPFAGHNSRMQATFQCDRNYIGYDISKIFMEFNRKVALEATKNVLFKPEVSITLHEQSSESLVEKDSSVDLVFTSPPYYNVEYYGNEPEQMYFSKDYQTFLDRMQVVVNECHRVLKPNKYCVFNINDFRANNQFFTYHCDIVTLFKKAGFKLHDIIIVKWPSAIGACFASQVEDRKVTAKSHEYLVVGKKIG